jgi:hypothetical protein
VNEKSQFAKRKLTGKLNTENGPAGWKASGLPMDEKWMTGRITAGGKAIPLISTRLRFEDRMGSWKARWALGRMSYKIQPGLYGIGRPDAESPVLVTANYKMTFDRVRKELSGVSAWILILDTKGINVWCAAGKGTFGTRELIRRIRDTGLDQIVTHRRVILPQLGATGVKAHEVARSTGFHIIYGPVRAADIPAFLDAGMVADAAMRRVRFGFMDRLVLTPGELVFTLKPAVFALGILFILNAVGFGQYGLVDFIALAGTLLTGCVLVPVLLPVIPGRAFTLKGAILGLVWAAVVVLMNGWPADSVHIWLKDAAFILALPSVSAFLAMNFTGSTTYTSPSGVNREMRRSLPVMFIAATLGVLTFLASDITRLLGK